jgi:hypothetical protein
MMHIEFLLGIRSFEQQSKPQWMGSLSGRVALEGVAIPFSRVKSSKRILLAADECLVKTNGTTVEAV